MKDPFNILVAGVGGQGNLLCGRVLAEAAVQQGLRPVVGDTFGASRRGGSVLTHLRIGSRDWPPLIPRGEVDILLGLEPLEALRAAVDYAGERTIAIVGRTTVPTVDVSSGLVEYPLLEQIERAITRHCQRLYSIDTDTTLARIGSHRVLNSYLLGALSSLPQSPLDQKLIRGVLSDIIDSDRTNLTAFDEGCTSLH